MIKDIISDTNSIKNNRIFKKSFWYWGSLLLGCLIILAGIITSPKRFKNIKELSEYQERKKAKIIATVDQRSLGTFSPNYQDRNFWENLDQKPNKLEPPKENDIRTLGDISTIKEGTKQECYFNQNTWVKHIEKSIENVLAQEWYDKTLFDYNLVDLNTTDTAATLANCIGLIGNKLNPELVKRTKKEIRQRVLDPYLKDLKLSQHKELNFTKDKCPWIGSEGNWSAVCTANILYSAMIIADSPQELGEIVEKTQENIQDYLKSYEDDGYLSEGIRYWNYGFSHFLLLAETILKITNSEINLYENPKIKKIIEYPLKTIIGANTIQETEYYPLFTDNSNPVKMSKDSWEWYIISKRAKLPFDVLGTNKSVYYGAKLDLILNMPKTEENFVKQKIEPSSGTVYFKSGGVLITKWRDGKEVVAIKGGTNRERHNHNDIGSYTLFSSGKSSKFLPVAGDIGDIEYTKENIGTERYTEELISSYGHPVPTVESQLQNTSPKAKATVILAETDQSEDRIIYELKSAYDVQGLQSLIREAIIKKGTNNGLEIADTIESQRPLILGSPIITAVKPTKISDKEYEIKIEENTYKVEIEATTEIISEIQQINDKGYRNTTRGIDKELSSPHRINITLKYPQTRGTIKYRIYRVTKENKPIPLKAIPPAIKEKTDTETMTSDKEQNGKKTPIKPIDPEMNKNESIWNL